MQSKGSQNTYLGVWLLLKKVSANIFDISVTAVAALFPLNTA